jgi:Trypsin
MHIFTLGRGKLVSIAFVLCACGASNDGTDTIADTSDAIVGGTLADDSAPDIGLLQSPVVNGKVWLCTGTLVRPSVVLTAAHCSKVMSAGSIFRIHAHGTDHDFTVKTPYYNPAYRPQNPEQNTPQDTGSDVGLIKLTSSVPSSVAGTRAMAFGSPSGDTVVNEWGYAGTPHKRYRSFQWKQRTLYLQHGDSGGPVLRSDIASHPVFRVNSAVGDQDWTAPLVLNQSWINGTLAVID